MSLSQFLRVEGGLLPWQLLERVAQGDDKLEGSSPASYHEDSSGLLNHAIHRSWASLGGRWESLRAQLANLPPNDPRALTFTRERWLLPLFQELGYGRLPEAPPLLADERSFPISHRWEAVPVHLTPLADLDKRADKRTSPHGLLQDLLNLSLIHI